MNKEIAGKLLALRKQNGYSQEELAEKLGVSRQAVSKWERAEASPDTENLIAIAKIYNISLDRLFDLSIDDSEQRSSINLEKKREEDPEIRIKYPENSAAQERYINSNQQLNSVQYKEPENNYGAYFKYETVDDRPEDNTDYNSGSDNSKRNNSLKNKFMHLADKIRNDKKFYKKLIKFPYPVATIAWFIVFGALFGLWHPMWMAFLTIPLYYTTIEAIRNRNANIFCYPVLVVLVFLILGFAVNLWHPAWLLFLTIPTYYWAINTYNDDPEKNK